MWLSSILMSFCWHLAAVTGIPVVSLDYCLTAALVVKNLCISHLSTSITLLHKQMCTMQSKTKTVWILQKMHWFLRRTGSQSLYINRKMNTFIIGFFYRVMVTDGYFLSIWQCAVYIIIQIYWTVYLTDLATVRIFVDNINWVMCLKLSLECLIQFHTKLRVHIKWPVHTLVSWLYP